MTDYDHKIYDELFEENHNENQVNQILENQGPFGHKIKQEDKF
jgi:hypothetical protein